MRLTTAAAMALALAGTQMAGPAASQQQTPDTTEMELEGNLPEGTLAEDRAGAIGENPDAVRQGGADAEQAESATAPTGELPEDTLLKRRQGAIGEAPEPAVQDGEDTAEE